MFRRDHCTDLLCKWLDDQTYPLMLHDYLCSELRTKHHCVWSHRAQMDNPKVLMLSAYDVNHPSGSNYFYKSHLCHNAISHSWLCHLHQFEFFLWLQHILELKQRLEHEQEACHNLKIGQLEVEAYYEIFIETKYKVQKYKIDFFEFLNESNSQAICYAIYLIKPFVKQFIWSSRLPNNLFGQAVCQTIYLVKPFAKQFILSSHSLVTLLHLVTWGVRITKMGGAINNSLI
jgi:hypothetical protein